MSLIGRFIHLRMGCGVRLSSLRTEEFQVTSPFPTNLATNLDIGAFKTIDVVGILWECPLEFLNLLISPLTLEVRYISVPRKCALPLAAFVIRVFSCESSNFSSSLRKIVIFSFKSLAKLDGPATPINQSSAYLT